MPDTCVEEFVVTGKRDLYCVGIEERIFPHFMRGAHDDEKN